MRWNPFGREKPISIKEEMEKLDNKESGLAGQAVESQKTSPPSATSAKEAPADKKKSATAGKPAYLKNIPSHIEQPDVPFTPFGSVGPKVATEDNIDPNEAIELGMLHGSPDLDEWMHDRQRQELIQEAMEKLHFSPFKKMIVNLTLEGYSPTEIAELTAGFPGSRKRPKINNAADASGQALTRVRIAQILEKSTRQIRHYVSNRLDPKSLPSKEVIKQNLSATVEKRKYGLLDRAILEHLRIDSSEEKLNKIDEFLALGNLPAEEVEALNKFFLIWDKSLKQNAETKNFLTNLRNALKKIREHLGK